MRYYLLLILCVFFACSKTPNDAPVDSYRDVEFSVDMSQEVNNNLFDLDSDSLTLILDSSVVEMIDSDNDNIFSCIVPDLIFGQSYSYQYAVNSVLENLDENRSFTVNDLNNIIFDYYGEINPTILILLVNMSYQVEIQNFNPETQFVDVAGSFNNWDGANYELEQSDNNVYSITISGVEAGDELEFKFRIDGDWDNAEFPGYGGNRQHTVVQGENTLEVWYNDEGGS